jgi:hypothetical protein
MKKYTIEDLATGKCAVINDGSVEELREVLKRAFPNDLSPEDFRYEKYFRKNNTFSRWTWGNDYNLPTQSVKDFLVEEEQPFQYEYKWYDVREVLPDERFDRKLVLVTHPTDERAFSYYWDNDQEAFVYSLGDGTPAEWVLYWCPLPDLPQ